MNQKSSYSVDRGARNLLTFAFILFGILSIVFNTEVKRSVLYGIRLSAGSIIPSVFPFFVISDYIYQSSIIEKKGFFSRIYEFIFGLPSCTLPAFLLGNICGFPIGAKCINDLYRDGMISGKDAQRLLIISNNPSVAFTVSAIGAGVFHDLRYGILLYAATLLSSVFLGLITRRKATVSKEWDVITRQKFDFSTSVKAAGYNCITVSSFVIFFSALLGLLKKILGSKALTLALSLILEVGNACTAISEYGLSNKLSLTLSAFALGFSGLSVFFQTTSFIPREISAFRILIFKLFQGFITSFLAFAFLLLI